MKRNKGLRNIVIGFMLVMLCYNVINQRIAMNRIEEEYSSKQEELKLLTIENDRLTEAVEASESDPSYMEKLAREKLGLVKPGEVTVIDSQSVADGQ